ncbi:osmoprotectant NAGGN system M42 family peptidase [Aquipuribacter nitratireducens]|uniref:Osmoprotectant NAGGN system M42 family peptidase n=1 Tax=Aquipuribacter nitratireducens TaxID=650104 RepID=A0ABW0GIX3_9MICO
MSRPTAALRRVSATATKLPVDTAYLRDVMLELLCIPSPSGRTDAVMQRVGDLLAEMGVELDITRRGVLRATLPGRRKDVNRAVVVHADTIGTMVKRLKENGRLEVMQVGTHSARFAEGAHVTILTDEPDRTYTGTVLPLKSSGHTYGDEIDTFAIGWDEVEVRIDAPVYDVQGLLALGIQVGDFVALDAAPQITPLGYVKSRHLDDKAGLAACLAALKAVTDAGITPPVTARLLVTIGEEVGHGATHGFDSGTAEIVAVDNGVVAPGQQSREESVSVGMMDSTGPHDFHLTRRLLALADEHGIPAVRDVYRVYRSDAAPAVESGVEARTALLGFGLDSSHGHERTHLDGLQHLAELLAVYLQGDLTFADWDVHESGALDDFPSTAVQPTPVEPTEVDRRLSEAERRQAGQA